MIVSELIEVLKKMPQDAVVIFDLYSDYAAMETEQIALIKAEERRIVFREQNGYSDYNPLWYPEGESPNFVTVVKFPGN